MLPVIITSIALLIVTGLAAVLIPFNLKRLHIIRCADNATNEQLEDIYTLIEDLGTTDSTCAVLARTNRRSENDNNWIISVPSYVKNWQGMSIVLKTDPEIAFCFSSSQTPEPILNGRIYRVVPVPKHLTKSGKARNQFSPTKHVANNLPLVSALSSVCPKYPIELLSFLYTTGCDTFEYDPMFQTRIGGSPSWVQSAEFPICDDCKKRMSMILQIPGAMLPGKLSAGTFYFFGCVNHQKRVSTVAQFT